MVSRLIRLDFGIASLALLAGSTLCLGLIQLLAGPLEDVASIHVQLLAVQSIVLLAPLLIILLVLLRNGPQIVRWGSRLGGRGELLLRQMWLQQLGGFVVFGVALVPYVLAGALVAAMTTRPELDSISELRLLLGDLNPLSLLFSLIKTALFGAITLWITLQQGARAQRRGLGASAGFARAISIAMGVVLGLDLLWALLFTPLVSGNRV